MIATPRLFPPRYYAELFKVHGGLHIGKRIVVRSGMVRSEALRMKRSFHHRDLDLHLSCYDVDTYEILF